MKGKTVTGKEKSQDGLRDSSLFLFHALGKILYCKRMLCIYLLFLGIAAFKFYFSTLINFNSDIILDIES